MPFTIERNDFHLGRVSYTHTKLHKQTVPYPITIIHQPNLGLHQADVEKMPGKRTNSRFLLGTIKNFYKKFDLGHSTIIRFLYPNQI